MTRPKSIRTSKIEDRPFRDAQRGIRLQKAMAEAGVASRRDCEEMVLAGRVTVNGTRIVELPAWVEPLGDRIELDGEPITPPRRTKKGRAKKTYVMVHKPRRVISTNDDPEGRKRVIDLVDAPMRARLFPVGRLDAESTGLILLTDDGELANRLTHPRYEVTKDYQVQVRGRLGEEDLERLRKGLILATDGKTKKASVEAVRILGTETDRTRGDRTTLAIRLREGQNREIRRLLARTGVKVRRLKRVGIGPLRLKGLAIGEWRMLTPAELGALRKATGLRARA